MSYLVEYRLDITKQYPALALTANSMDSQQNSIKSGFDILIKEIESGDLVLNSPQAYPLLLKAYANWFKAISQVRIYMANRLATYSSLKLKNQGESLTDFYLVFKKNLQELERLYTKEASFEGVDIIKTNLILSQSWYEGFTEVREISESDEWRSDTLIIKTKVFPLVTKITESIAEIEDILKKEKLNADLELVKSDEAFNLLIFMIIGLILLFLLLILISMEWLIFSPIEKVTLALKSNSFQHDLSEIKTSKSLEIGRLIEAYVEMNKQVTGRQNALEHQAMHDYLTGLPNRFLLTQRIEYQLLNSERRHCPFVLFFMDLDFFKEINDTLGHATGDRLLIEVSNRIQMLIRKSDTLARLGGDEFSLLLPDTQKEGAAKVAGSIFKALKQPIDIDNQKINISMSIGIVNYPDDGKDIETLLQFADMAMYTAKQKRLGYSFYDPSQNIYSKKRLDLIQDVSEALEQDLFEIYFQPQVSSQNSQLYGAEALLRWNHKEYGFVSPEKIIEAAERTGLIHKLTLRILEKAISACSQWHQANHVIKISVNLSVRDLSNVDLVKKVKALMEKYQLGYQYLTLECQHRFKSDPFWLKNTV